MLSTSLALGACSGSDSDEYDSELMSGGQTDAGSSPGEDAQVAMPDAGGPMPDAGGPMPDAGEHEPDAHVLEPELEGVSLTVRQGSVPLANATVLLHDQAGELLDQLLTDQNGQAFTPLAPHVVTLLPPADNLDLLQGALAYVGVEDGDALQVELPAAYVELPTVGTIELTYPTQAGAQYYIAYAGNENCLEFVNGGQGQTVQIPLTSVCTSPSMDVVIVGMANGMPQLVGVIPDLAPPAAGGTTAVTFDGNWVSPNLLELSAVNLPSEGNPHVSSYTDGQRVYSGDGLVEVSPNHWQFPYPATADAFLIDFAFAMPAINENLHASFRRRTASTAPVAFDGNDALIPTRVTSIDDSVPLRPILAFSQANPQIADAVFLTTSVSLPENQGSFGLGLVLAPGIASFQMPQLAAIAEHFGIVLGETPMPELDFVTTKVYEGDTVEDYRALRQEIVHFEVYEGVYVAPDMEWPSAWRWTEWSPPGI